MQHSPNSPLHPDQRWPLFWLAIVAPVFLWIVDYTLLIGDSRWNTAARGWWASIAIHVFFILQVGLMGWAIGNDARTRQATE